MPIAADIRLWRARFPAYQGRSSQVSLQHMYMTDAMHNGVVSAACLHFASGDDARLWGRAVGGSSVL